MKTRRQSQVNRLKALLGGAMARDSLTLSGVLDGHSPRLSAGMSETEKHEVLIPIITAVLHAMASEGKFKPITARMLKEWLQ